jgi:hypothetical protein
MPAIEAAAAGLAKTVASRAAMQWLAYRRDRDGSSSQLSDLVALRFRDRFLRRKIELQLEGITAELTERIERSFGSDGGFPANESAAALDVVTRTFGADARTDEVLFAADADPDALAARLRPALVANAETAGLSEGATRLAELVLVDCVRCHVEMVRHLPEFNNRASQEALTRFSRISADITEILSRLPAPGPPVAAHDADEGAAVARYLRFVSTEHDQLETLYLNSDADIDLAGFAGRRRLVVWADARQKVRNAEGVRVRQ